MILLIILLLLLLYCHEEPFGTILGTTQEGVIAFSGSGGSNLSSPYGKKWECVEFVRRFLVETRGITFPSVENAYDIWNLDHFTTLDGTPVEIQKLDIQSIATGDIMIWRAAPNSPAGHVAVVAHVGRTICLVEQNNLDVKWNGPYARCVAAKSLTDVIGLIRL